MVQENRTCIDCACVIHGSGYNWDYVEKLYNMVQRHLGCEVRFHVYTEAERSVPAHMIKHELEVWPGVGGLKRSWWYKLQLFNADHHKGNLLYFDLDTVIIDSIDWITHLSTDKFWTIRDFKYLQQEHFNGMNSSVMWWNVCKYDWVWQEFEHLNKDTLHIVYPKGDQQYLGQVLGNDVQYFPESNTQSWRWQVWEGGLQFPEKTTKLPGAGAVIPANTSVLVFHGQPKPHELLDDVVIKQHWR